MENCNSDENNVHNCVGAEEYVGRDKPHEPCRTEPSNAECCQRAGEEIPGHLFRLVSKLLNVLNEVAPGPHLPADIEELRHYCHPEMRVCEQFAKMPVVAAGLMFAFYIGELCPPDQH